MVKNNRLKSRRKVLKITSSGLVAASAFSTVGSASENSDEDCDHCASVEIIAEDKNIQIIRVERNDRVYDYQVNKEEGSVKPITVDRPVSTIDIRNRGNISIQNHENIIEKSDYDVNKEGDCGGHIYSSHYSVVFTFTTGDSLDDYPSGALEAGLCAVIGGAAGSRGGYVGLALAGLGAIACFSIGYFFLDHVDYSGKSGAIGAWDCHTGFLGEEGLCTGVSNSYTTDSEDLSQARKIQGAHLSLGEDVASYISI